MARKGEEAHTLRFLSCARVSFRSQQGMGQLHILHFALLEVVHVDVDAVFIIVSMRLATCYVML